MTLQEAKSIARHLGLTLRKVRSGHYRANVRDGNETRPITPIPVPLRLLNPFVACRDNGRAAARAAGPRQDRD